MKRLTSFLVLFLLLGVGQGVWAGPREEVAQALRQWGQAFNKGNLDALMALYADDAHITSAFGPFRHEGKRAIKRFFAGFFKARPTRRTAPAHPSIRVYGDSMAALTTYATLILVDEKDQATTHHLRVSRAYVKQGGKWLIVNHHTSRVPASR